MKRIFGLSLMMLIIPILIACQSKEELEAERLENERLEEIAYWASPEGIEEKYQEFLSELKIAYDNEQYPEVMDQIHVHCADYIKIGDINKCVEDGQIRDDSIEFYNKAFNSYFNKNTLDLKILEDSILRATYNEVQEDLLNQQNKEIYNGEVLTNEIDYIRNKSVKSIGSNSNNKSEIDKAQVYAFMKATYKRVTNSGESYTPEIHDPLVAYYASIKYDISEDEAGKIYIEGEMGKF